MQGRKEEEARMQEEETLIEETYGTNLEGQEQQEGPELESNVQEEQGLDAAAQEKLDEQIWEQLFDWGQGENWDQISMEVSNFEASIQVDSQSSVHIPETASVPSQERTKLITRKRTTTGPQQAGVVTRSKIQPSSSNTKLFKPKPARKNSNDLGGVTFLGVSKEPEHPNKKTKTQYLSKDPNILARVARATVVNDEISEKEWRLNRSKIRFKAPSESATAFKPSSGPATSCKAPSSPSTRSSSANATPTWASSPAANKSFVFGLVPTPYFGPIPSRGPVTPTAPKPPIPSSSIKVTIAATKGSQSKGVTIRETV